MNQPTKKEPAQQASPFDFQRTALYKDSQEPSLGQRLESLTDELEQIAQRIEKLTDTVRAIIIKREAKKIVQQWSTPEGMADWRHEQEEKWLNSFGD